MMAAQTILFLFLLFHSLLLQTCVAKPYCPPSSCGIIPNITSPFRLQTDPNYCGDRSAELLCENNVTFLYLHSQKYFVKAINYYSFFPSIRVVDASINNHTCSFPNTSAYLNDFSTGRSAYSIKDQQSPINLMSCPHPLKNHSLYTDVTHCHSSNSGFSYIMVGRMKASVVKHMSRVDVIMWTSWEFKDLNNASLEEIHSSLLYGFEIVPCPECLTSWTLWDMVKFFIWEAKGWWLLFIPFGILVFLSAGVSLPLMLIIGFTYGLILLLEVRTFAVLFGRGWDYNYVRPYVVVSSICRMQWWI